MSDTPEGRRGRRAPIDLASMPPGRILGLVLGGLLVVVVLIVFLSGFKKTPRDQVGLSYGGGPIEGAHFQQVVTPGHGLFFNGIADKLYMYPVTQRNYIISKKSGEGDIGEEDFVRAPSKDRIPTDYEVAVYFKLNTDKVKQFHEQIGLKYQAWTEAGWDKMLRDSFRQQIEFALQRESRKYDVGDIYANAAVLKAIQIDVGTVLKENVSQVLGDDYFCGPTFRGGSCPQFTFVLKHVDIPEDVRKAFEENRTSQIAVLTKMNEVKQREQEAEAIRKLTAALRDPNYVLLRAVESGKVTFWVVPQGSDFTLQAPPP
jgi:regulator of protease activity HflC (stomatin/prohibitin superfamily)